MLIAIQSFIVIYTVFVVGRAFARFLNSLFLQVFHLPCEKNTGKLSQQATESDKVTFNLFSNIGASQILLTPIFTTVLLIPEVFFEDELKKVPAFDLNDLIMYTSFSLGLSFLWVTIVLFSVSHSKRMFYLFTREIEIQKPTR